MIMPTATRRPARSVSPRAYALRLALTLAPALGCTGETSGPAVPATNAAPTGATPATATPVPAKPEPIAPEPAKPAPARPATAATVPSLDEGPLVPGLFRPQPAAGGSGLPRFVTPLPAVDVAGIERATPGWALALEFETSVKIERFVAGMLVIVGGVPHEPGPDGALVARPEVDHAKIRILKETDTVLGTWPADAWRLGEYVQERGPSSLSFFTMRANGQWAAQPLIDGPRILDYMLGGYQWSPRGGVLLVPARRNPRSPAGPIKFHRVGGKQPDPGPMVLSDTIPRGVVETPDGSIYLYTEPLPPANSFTVDFLRHCDQNTAPGCERVDAVGLGIAVERAERRPNYQLGMMAPRQGANFSAEIREYAGGPGRTYLVHRERGGWTLDAVPGDLSVAHLLPTADGSLWIVLSKGYRGDETLWHRGPTGKWVAVPLPEGADPYAPIQIALRDPEQVWLAVDTRDSHAIYSARAALQASAAEVR